MNKMIFINKDYIKIKNKKIQPRRINVKLKETGNNEKEKAIHPRISKRGIS